MLYCTKSKYLWCSIVGHINSLVEKRSPWATLRILAIGIKKELMWKKFLPSLFVCMTKYAENLPTTSNVLPLKKTGQFSIVYLRLEELNI